MAVLSAFSDEVSHDLDEQIAFLQSNRVSAMEIRFVDGNNIVTHSDASLRSIKAKLDAAGIRVSAIGSPIGKVRLSDNWKKHLELFRRTLEIAHTLEAPMIRMFSFYPPEHTAIDGLGEEVLERMRQMVGLMVGSSIKLIHENEAGIFGHSAENCVYLASHLDRAYFGLAYDPANFVWGEKITHPTASCWKKMKPYVDHIHIKDWKLGDTLGAIPGEGHGDVPELLKELSEMNYNGFMTMEPHLSKGGQFGGETTPAAFAASIEAVRTICEQVNLPLDD